MREHYALSPAGFLITKERTMLNNENTDIRYLAVANTHQRYLNPRQLSKPDHIRDVTKMADPMRRLRSLRCCHLPAEEQPLQAPPRDSAAYVPELAARIDDDQNLTDGARRCARKLGAYVYRHNRDGRAAEITVTYLMKALRRSRRTVQRYLRQLEAAGYIGVEVIHTRTRMCAGLAVALLAPLFPRHGWPQKLMKPDAPKLSQKDRFRYRYSRKSWASRCMDGVYRSFMKTLPPLAPFPATI
jgi:hypothetical protein